ncbi:MAG: type II toxin-antitoxin system death-on-curing family toxin [Candidatus Tokpelaia sp.]|uniref:type II toxin-antitoxin system death-on-curing family toxin n=1 Tax=Candidatus Tokpelaia sp. TaxID=2233777 RepID=UPI00123A599F|nr:type II toxin-antitoxin system death-on-curing family toxin [Candidatus Tokpelaia sp.]KAA6204871.1 MAG: type II toxin-antitoxin system death-on-curing family toxin [Candidatus Tokpelaia sp.]KAA6207554.1 MAG: type II toxin-antitoxin system death-on-curing family toxin [Candidatus Tokpelaia sp.]KAA6404723.1 hypothetical protein DPQ22_07255 [Candidatus Tokpelaia sp.]
MFLQGQDAIMNGTVADRISAGEITQIHTILTEKFSNSKDPISPPGIKDRNMLESSAARAFQSAGIKAAYGTIHQKAAVLFHAIINNHPFYNGNKRTALIAAQVLLARENYWLHDITDKQLYEFTKKTAAHKISEDKKMKSPILLNGLKPIREKPQKVIVL